MSTSYTCDKMWYPDTPAISPALLPKNPPSTRTPYQSSYHVCIVINRQLSCHNMIRTRYNYDTCTIQIHDTHEHISQARTIRTTRYTLDTHTIHTPLATVCARVWYEHDTRMIWAHAQKHMIRAWYERPEMCRYDMIHVCEWYLLEALSNAQNALKLPNRILRTVYN